jgi:ABC-type lipoprotein release transport system permease subunit
MGILTRAARNISRRKTRALLLIVVLSLALTIITSLPPNIVANQKGNQQVIDELLSGIQANNENLNLSATQMACTLHPEFRSNNRGPYKDFFNGGGTMYTPFLNITDFSNLTSIPEIVEVIPIMQYEYGENNQTYDFIWNGSSYPQYLNIEGIPLEATYLESYPSILPSNISAGRNLQAEDQGVVVLQEVVADYFNVTVGDTINLLGQNFTVVGIEGTGRSWQAAAYMSLGEAQSITNTTGQALKLSVFADSIENVDTVESKIKEQYPQLEVQTSKAVIKTALESKAGYEKQMQTAQAAVNNLENIAIMQIGILVPAQIAIILLIMLYSVRERTKEIGTLKAIGASNSTILAQFILEGTLLSLIAGAVGIAIGTVGASTIGNLLLPRLQYGFGQSVTVPLAVTITPELVLAGLGIAVALGALGSLYPAWRAAKIRPAEAMRHE